MAALANENPPVYANVNAIVNPPYADEFANVLVKMHSNANATKQSTELNDFIKNLNVQGYKEQTQNSVTPNASSSNALSSKFKLYFDIVKNYFNYINLTISCYIRDYGEGIIGFYIILYSHRLIGYTDSYLTKILHKWHHTRSPYNNSAINTQCIKLNTISINKVNGQGLSTALLFYTILYIHMYAREKPLILVLDDATTRKSHVYSKFFWVQQGLTTESLMKQDDKRLPVPQNGLSEVFTGEIDRLIRIHFFKWRNKYNIPNKKNALKKLLNPTYTPVHTIRSTIFVNPYSNPSKAEPSKAGGTRKKSKRSHKKNKKPSKKYKRY